jgi:hypothetical protein
MTYKCTFYQMDTNGSTFFFHVNSGFMLLVWYAMDWKKEKINVIKYLAKIFFSHGKGIIFRKHQISTMKCRLAFFRNQNMRWWQLKKIRSYGSTRWWDLLSSHCQPACLRREKWYDKICTKIIWINYIVYTNSLTTHTTYFSHDKKQGPIIITCWSLLNIQNTAKIRGY